MDNAIQFTVVTASGDFITVNAYQNPDLFWALRGGGGGTFAVVLSVTYITYDPLPLTMFSFSANFSTPEITQNVMTEWIKMHPTLADNEWGGYSTWSQKRLGFTYVAPNISTADANATFGDFISYVQSVVPTASDLATQFTPLDSFYSFFKIYDSLSSALAGYPSEQASRLIPRSKMQSNASEVAKAMLAPAQTSVPTMVFASGRQTFLSLPDADSASLNPAWRASTGLVIFIDIWPEGSSVSDILAIRERNKKNIETIDTVAGTASATYFNEASLYEKDFNMTFFGSHYPRLRSLKDLYDPNAIFVVPAGVGSEDWDANLECRI